MVDLNDVVEALDARKRKILLFAEGLLAPAVFRTFRKLVLDELGNSGFVKDLQGLQGSDRQKTR